MRIPSDLNMMNNVVSNEVGEAVPVIFFFFWKENRVRLHQEALKNVK